MHLPVPHVAHLYLQINDDKWIFCHIVKCEIHGGGFVLYRYNAKVWHISRVWNNICNFDNIIKVILCHCQKVNNTGKEKKA